MDRKDFLRSMGVAGFVSIANPTIFSSSYSKEISIAENPQKRLYQGPFPVYSGSYPINNIEDWEVVMTTTPGKHILKNFGMGMVVYTIDENGPPNIQGETLEESIEKLAKISFAKKLYMRVNWKDVQKEPGKLHLSDAWKYTFKMAEKYRKKIGFRIMMQNPSIFGHTLPKFLREKIPFLELNNETGKKNETGGLRSKKQRVPYYGNPTFQKAWKDLDSLLADKYNGHPNVEYMDTYMYGFWGEGHTYPIKKIPFADHIVAEETFMDMFYHQLRNWDNVPLLTNTQPDFNHAGNDALIRETLRTQNWLRSDTIFIENQQIDELSNRFPWIGSASEVGMFRGANKKEVSANVLNHVNDIGSNYCSLWRWHNISADPILEYYRKYPEVIDEFVSKIGYRIRPSFIWHIRKENRHGLIFGLVNDGNAGVPGQVKLTLKDERGKVIDSGYLDQGYPFPSGVRQARMWLPEGIGWKGLKLFADIEVKGQLYPIQWACSQKLNNDGSLKIEPIKSL